MPVHLSGIPSDLDQLNKICKKKKLHLIEDAAHAFGTNIKIIILAQLEMLVFLVFIQEKVFMF